MECFKTGFPKFRSSFDFRSSFREKKWKLSGVFKSQNLYLIIHGALSEEFLIPITTRQTLSVKFVKKGIPQYYSHSVSSFLNYTPAND